jgi:putative transcriptional regulator
MVYKDIISGLQEAVENEKGNLKLRTVKVSLKPLKRFEADEVKSIRTMLGMSQGLFAGFIGVSPKTVEAWEAGRNTPNGPASRILDLIQQDPKLPERYGIIE